MDLESSAYSLDEILSVALDEIVRSRLRNRALLQLLVEREVISRLEYLEAYKKEEGTNFEAISDMLLLPPEAFREKHGAWLERQRELFGFTPTSYPRITLTPKVLADVEEPSGKKTKERKKASRRKPE